MGKVVIIAKLTARPGRFDELLELVRWMVQETEAEPGTEAYSANADADEGAVWMYELYSDDRAFAAHSTSDTMRRFVAELEELAEPEMTAHTLSLVASAGLQP